jgi:hypothetical protein
MSCHAGWIGPSAGSCYHLTTAAYSHANCVQECGLLNASLTCISGLAEQAFMSEVMAAVPQGDAWIGLYQATGSAELRDGWVACASGEPSNWTDAYPWAPTQPNADNENCAALWQDFELEWRDAPCSLALRCLCERDIGGSEQQISPAYLNFAAMEDELYDHLISVARTWLLLLYLVIVPILTAIPLACCYYCNRRSYQLHIQPSANRSLASSATSTSSTEGTVLANAEGANRLHNDASEANAPTASTLATDGRDPSPRRELMDEATTVTMLRETEKQASKLRALVCGFTFAAGIFLFWTGCAPLFIPFTAGPSTYRAIELVMGNADDCLGLIVPWSIALLTASLRPVDQVVIWRVGTFMFILHVVATAVGSPLATPITTRHTHAPLVLRACSS